jgi:hypothetical protein
MEGRDLRTLKWVQGDHLARKGVYLYHYSLLFPKHVKEKCLYYQKADWARREKAVAWFEKDYLCLRRPFRVHNVYDYPSWLERFKGEHPEQVVQLMKDVSEGKVGVTLRQTDDVERLLGSRTYYRLRLTILKLWDYFDRVFEFCKRSRRETYFKVRSILASCVHILRWFRAAIRKKLCD